MSDLTSIGAVVRQRREELNLSRSQLARLADVSVSTLDRLELHGQVPSVCRLASIATALDLPLSELVAA